MSTVKELGRTFASHAERRRFEHGFEKQLEGLLLQAGSLDVAEDVIFRVVARRLPGATVRVVFELQGERSVHIESTSLSRDLLVEIDGSDLDH